MSAVRGADRAGMTPWATGADPRRTLLADQASTVRRNVDALRQHAGS